MRISANCLHCVHTLYEIGCYNMHVNKRSAKNKGAQICQTEVFIMLTAKNNSLSFFDPFREMEELEKAFFGVPYGRRFPVRKAYGTDIRDEGDKYVLEADLPGFNKDDIHVDLDDGSLTISAERSSDKEDKDDERSYVRRERFYGSYSRSFSVKHIDTDAITASYADGVLTLIMPKKAPDEPTARRLEIK